MDKHISKSQQLIYGGSMWQSEDIYSKAAGQHVFKNVAVAGLLHILWCLYITDVTK
jgi:hypothetical protein